jgi:hypothetical protein
MSSASSTGTGCDRPSTRKMTSLTRRKLSSASVELRSSQRVDELGNARSSAKSNSTPCGRFVRSAGRPNKCTPRPPGWARSSSRPPAPRRNRRIPALTRSAIPSSYGRSLQPTAAGSPDGPTQPEADAGPRRQQAQEIGMPRHRSSGDPSAGRSHRRRARSHRHRQSAEVTRWSGYSQVRGRRSDPRFPGQQRRGARAPLRARRAALRRMKVKWTMAAAGGILSVGCG